jgi:hypothetical protein
MIRIKREEGNEDRGMRIVFVPGETNIFPGDSNGQCQTKGCPSEYFGGME